MRAVGYDIERIAREAIVGKSIIQRALTAGIAVGIDPDGLAAE